MHEVVLTGTDRSMIFKKVMNIIRTAHSGTISVYQNARRTNFYTTSLRLKGKRKGIPGAREAGKAREGEERLPCRLLLNSPFFHQEQT